MKQMSRGERFTAAFNDIEDEFRRALNPDRHARFLEMARAYASQHHLSAAQRDALQTCASLRNAISRGRWYDGQPIAEPNEALVRGIEQLRDQVMSPPTAVSLLPDGPCERVLFASSAITAAEAIDQLPHGGEGRTPVTALLLTRDGQESGTPVRIIAGSDLPALSEALGTGPS